MRLDTKSVNMTNLCSPYALTVVVRSYKEYTNMAVNHSFEII